MENKFDKIIELKKEIEKLPKGYISTKVINGKTYHYHQFSVNGKKESKYLSDEEYYKLNQLLIQKKLLQQELDTLRNNSAFTSAIVTCALMHKNTKVLDFIINDETGAIERILTTYELDHLPVGVLDTNGLLNLANLNAWWSERCIPASRSGLKEALEKLNVNNVKSLLIRCYGLSLSDQYWIKPTSSNLSWEDINFFDNSFSDDVGEILLGGKKKGSLNLSSPDFTSVGNLKKRWKIVNNKRVLIKGSSNPFRQEAVNEVVADKVLNILDIPHVHYSLIWDKEVPYSVCEDFIDVNSDLVPAYQVCKIIKKNNSDSTYNHLIKCYKALGVNNVQDFLNKMIVFDFIIANEDRHLNNFGLIRNVNKPNEYKLAPLFDNGSSLGFDKINEDINGFSNIETKPFNSNPLKQLKLVTSFDFIDKDKIKTIPDIIFETLSKYESKHLNKERIAVICNSVSQRINYLIEII